MLHTLVRFTLLPASLSCTGDLSDTYLCYTHILLHPLARAIRVTRAWPPPTFIQQSRRCEQPRISLRTHDSNSISFPLLICFILFKAIESKSLRRFKDADRYNTQFYAYGCSRHGCTWHPGSRHTTAHQNNTHVDTHMFCLAH
jgi:hypothetical protein